MDETKGKIYELGGPEVYTMEEMYEIFQNMIRKPIKFIRLNEHFWEKVTHYVGWEYLNREMIVKSKIDLNVQEGALGY